VYAFGFSEPGDVYVPVGVGLGVKAKVPERTALLTKYKVVLWRHAA
jgi:hypothetical protein